MLPISESLNILISYINGHRYWNIEILRYSVKLLNVANILISYINQLRYRDFIAARRYLRGFALLLRLTFCAAAVGHSFCQNDIQT
jgi:hypothetical protein